MNELLNRLSELTDVIRALPENEASSDALALCNYLSWSVKQSESNLLVPQLVAALLSPINNAIRNRGNVNVVTTNLVNALKILPAPLNKKRPKSESQKLISNLRKEIDAAKAELEKTSEGFSDVIKNQKSEIENLQNDLSKAKTTIDAQSVRLDTLVDSAQTTFNEKRSEVGVENDKLISEFRKELDTERTAQTKKFEEAQGAFQGYLDGKQIEADERIRKLDVLLGLAGDKSLIADYSEISKKEGGASFWWSIAAIVILVFGIAIGASIVLTYGLPDRMTIPSLISRIILPLSVFVPGFYCAAKAREHRNVQVLARSTGVRLATLEPYLAKMSEEKRAEKRAELLDEFFKSKTVTSKRAPLIGMSSKNMLELIKEVKEGLS